MVEFREQQYQSLTRPESRTKNGFNPISVRHIRTQAFLGNVAVSSGLHPYQCYVAASGLPIYSVDLVEVGDVALDAALY